VEHNKQHEFTFIIETEGIGIEDNRNEIAEKAKGSDYLLFVDDDMVFEPTLLQKLMESNKKVIGVASKSRVGAYTVKQLGIKKPITQSLFQARAVGTGLMLIDMKVFDTIEKPYFKVERYKDNKVKTGEDVYFCDKVGDVWCDGRIDVKHIGDKLN
jgi:glycosyltransferase involved in cell wall biosynthesis